MDALLAAYRVGARVAWRELSAAAGRRGPARRDRGGVRRARLRLHRRALGRQRRRARRRAARRRGRVRERYLDGSASGCSSGASGDVLADAAERAGWDPPETLTAVLVPEAQVRPALALLDAAHAAGWRATSPAPTDAASCSVPDAAGPRRARLAAGAGGARRGRRARRARGPAVAASVRPGAAGAATWSAPRGGATVDTEAHLATLLIRPTPRRSPTCARRALEPLSELRPTAAERLEQTLRSWLLHQGRRDDVAAELMVHPQTVRYRMTQLRELYGDRLHDPAAVLDLVIALGTVPRPA